MENKKAKIFDDYNKIVNTIINYLFVELNAPNSK